MKIMKPKIIFATWCSLFFACTISAQEKTSNKEKMWNFQSITQIAALAGSSDADFLIQTINGLRHKGFFAGAGVGLDFYYQSSLPVTIELRQMILRKESSPFIYVGSGLNFPIATSSGSTFKSGGYYDLGCGYHVPMNQNFSFIVSLGYSIKKFSEQRTEKTFMPIPYFPLGTSDRTVKYDYDLRRIVLKIGLSF
jgi:hypothetical protein